MKTQAVRNCDIAASRKHLILLIGFVLFALLSSSCFAAAPVKPAFDKQQAFVLDAQDRKLYNANYAWCFPTPNDGYQCQVIGSALSGVLGAGSEDITKNIQAYGDTQYKPVSVMSLPDNIRKDIQDIYDFTWSM